MKIRNGFVSNSSTSSFVCEICGRQEAGSDSVGMDEYGFCQCENEHVICLEEVLDSENENDISEENCPICQFIVLSQKDMVRYLLKTTGIQKEEVFEEVKKFNKRRQKLYNAEYVRYVMQKKNLTEDSLIAELKSKFKNYKELLDFC